MWTPEDAWCQWCRRIEALDAALAEAFDDIPPTRLDLVEQIDTLHWFGFMLDELELE
ncbi:MAG: hypothetical protein ACXWVD_00030 [Telluria sp.]